MCTSETGTVRKKWKGRTPAALLYPNTYPVAVSNLGFQLLYQQLNSFDHLVCERFVYPEEGQRFRSLESSRPLADFSLIFVSVSFEHDYPALAAMLVAGGIEPYAEQRSELIEPGKPLLIFGGAAVFMNPEPLALFADLMVIGEAEPVLPRLVELLASGTGKRKDLLFKIGASLEGCYVPQGYEFEYDEVGRVRKLTVAPGLPTRVRKVVQKEPLIAAHSELLSPDAELGMYMVELGRGCSRGCRFCAAGFIYRPPRLWDADRVIAGLEARPPGVDRIGLLGMEMSDSGTLDRIARYLRKNNCSLSFSSLRADRISDQLLELLSESGLKSVAIAPDGSSHRLRQLINKGLSEADLLNAAVRLAEAGIYTLKLYVMIGLPTETEQDLDELVSLISKIQEQMLPIGRKRGRVCEIILSVNSFVPKPWTPFQYLSFGGQSKEQLFVSKDSKSAVAYLKKKIRYLKKQFSRTPNLHIKMDRPERVLAQAVFSRADRRIGSVLLDMGTGKLNFKQAMKAQGLTAWQFAVRPREADELFCWEVVDHGITDGYLHRDLEKGLALKATQPCDTAVCRRCGVC